MLKNISLKVLLALVLVGCAPSPSPPSEIKDPDGEESEQVVEEEVEQEGEAVVEKEEVSTELTVLATDLEIPWAIAKHEEVIFLSNRAGFISKIEDKEVVRQEVELEEEISEVSEAGLLGFVLAPDFSEKGEALAYYTYEGSGGPTNRIVRLQLKGEKWSEVEVLIDEIPSGNVHHGGRLKIGPDEKLYASTGDALDNNLPQDLNSLAGKILRLNLDGSIPADNPFTDSYIYTFGHRNPQGFTWLEDGRMFASEHGNQANDEINFLEEGRNYGWPLIEGSQEAAEMRTPIFTSGSDTTWAPSGMGSVGEKLYVAALRGNGILIFDLATGEMTMAATEFGRIRDVLIDGEFLYFITNNTDGRGNPKEDDDKLYRIGLKELK